MSKESDASRRVAIVGGGFSGTMVAANLARRGIASVLIEANGRAGQGAAYSTRDSVHLLNIRARNMGAWADLPEDFCAREGVDPGTFAQRRHFGAYLCSILDEAVASGLVEIVEGRATGAARDKHCWEVTVGNGPPLRSNALVLALGNQPPAALPGLDPLDPRVIDNPWSEAARAAIEDSARRQLDVLILGTSLTMIDVALSLDAAGHMGQIIALSRRGKIPLTNENSIASPIEWGEAPEPSVRKIAKWLRRRSAEVGWIAAVDSLRPHTQALWRAMPDVERRRFLRFGRPWWDIHRHRIAPQIARRVDELVARGRLDIVAGRLVEAWESDNGLELIYRRRGCSKADFPRRFGYVFNCTGPLADIRRTGDPLLRQLLDDGYGHPDELGIGLAVDDRLRVDGADCLWALGTLTKGRYWEVIAVPDIRVQAASVAHDIATELEA